MVDMFMALLVPVAICFLVLGGIMGFFIAIEMLDTEQHNEKSERSEDEWET